MWNPSTGIQQQLESNLPQKAFKLRPVSAKLIFLWFPLGRMMLVRCRPTFASPPAYSLFPLQSLLYGTFFWLYPLTKQRGMCLLECAQTTVVVRWECCMRSGSNFLPVALSQVLHSWEAVDIPCSVWSLRDIQDITIGKILLSLLLSQMRRGTDMLC